MFEDTVGYALQVAEEVDTHELSAYTKVVSSSESCQWHATIKVDKVSG